MNKTRLSHPKSRFLLTVFLCTSLLLGYSTCQAGSRHLFKIATLAPEGSVWMTKFHEFAEEVEERSEGNIRFKVYPGGVMGDDKAMYRKMRVGQLHGGGFTMTGISETVPDFRVMALPFLFNSYDEVDAVKKELTPIFMDTFRENKLELIAMTEVGFVYAMGTKPIVSIDQLKNGKCWSPAGDPLTSTFLSTIGINPVQLSIPDVLSSLQTGMVNTVFNSLYGSIVLQWFTKAKFITDIPYGYAYGVFLLDKRSFDKLDKQEQQMFRQVADKHFSILLDKTRQSNIESRQTLIDHGVEFLPIQEEIVQQLHTYRDTTVEKLSGKSFSKTIYKKTKQALTTHRNQQQNNNRKQP